MFYLALLLCTEVFGASVKINVNGVEKMYYDVNEAEIHFEQFILDHEKNYETDTEKLLRFEIFKENLKKINELNMKHDTVYGINEFSELTEEEFQQKYASDVGTPEEAMPCKLTKPDDLASIKLDGSFDWREKNGVTSVKHQQSCGACWAFSIVGCLESQYVIKKGQTLDLSEQQLVDCDSTSKGCGGGWINNAGLYIVENGLMSESDYKYQDVQGACSYDASKTVARASSCVQFDGISEEELKAALEKYGPISIAIDASAIDQNYNQGIVRYCNSVACSHAVLLVGYNDDGKDPYWIIKNSWGASWGENGYFRIPLGSGACMITKCHNVALQV